MSAKDVVHGNPTHTQRWVLANANFFFSLVAMMQPAPCVKVDIIFFYVLCSFLVCVAAPGLKENNEKI